MSYLTGTPVAGGSTVLAFGGSSCQELSYVGTASFVGDGSNTASTINYIDGTNALSFTPSAVMAVRVGGNAAASIVAYAADNADNGKTATITFSAAPANNATVKYAVFVLK